MELIWELELYWLVNVILITGSKTISFYLLFVPLSISLINKNQFVVTRVCLWFTDIIKPFCQLVCSHLRFLNNLRSSPIYRQCESTMVMTLKSSWTYHTCSQSFNNQSSLFFAYIVRFFVTLFTFILSL